MANKRWILFGLLCWVVATTILAAQDEDTSENTNDHHNHGLDHSSPPQDKSPPIESTNTGFFTAWIVAVGLIGVCVVVLVVFILWYCWWNREKKKGDLQSKHQIEKGQANDIEMDGPNAKQGKISTVSEDGIIFEQKGGERSINRSTTTRQRLLASKKTSAPRTTNH